MIKKVKVAIVVFATIVSMNVNAQKKAPAKSTKPNTEKASAKPTKQETMDWIAGKMKEKLVGKSEFISYSDGKFVYKVQIGAYDCISTIYLGKITGSSSEYSNDFYVKGTGIKYVDFGGNFTHNNRTENEISIGGPNYNEYPQPFDFNNDDPLVERLKKAFATLIEYNSSQKGADEKF